MIDYCELDEDVEVPSILKRLDIYDRLPRLFNRLSQGEHSAMMRDRLSDTTDFRRVFKRLLVAGIESDLRCVWNHKVV